MSNETALGDDQAMGTACRRFLAEQMLLAAIVNALLNGFGPWYFFSYLKMSSIPAFGQISIAGDVVGTVFILPFLVCLTLTLETYRQMKHGLRRGDATAGRFVLETRSVARTVLLRSLGLGSLCTLVLAPLLIGALVLTGTSEVGLLAFCVAKAIGAGALAAAIVPSIALRAMGDLAAVQEVSPSPTGASV